MGRRFLPSLAVVLVVGALLVGLVQLGLVGSRSPSATPAPSGAQASATPLPAGTYTSGSFKPAVTFTLPAGWEVPSDAAPYLQLRPAGSEVVGIHFFRDARAASQDPACPDTPEPGVGATSTDLELWIRGRPGLLVSNPKLVTVGGLRGTELDIGIKEGWTNACPFANGSPSVQLVTDGKGGYRWVVVGNERLRLYLLDLPGGGTVIVDVDAFDGRLFDPFIDSALPIVNSLSFARQ